MKPGLPHRPPFVFLDRILERQPGERAVAEKQFATADPFVGETGTLPTTLLAEVMAQCAGAAAGGEADHGMLVGVQDFRANGSVRVGDCARVEARVVRRHGAMLRAEAKISVGAVVVAEGVVLLRIGGAS